MAIKIFSLSGVDSQEASDIRKLLVENGIEFHETLGGSWVRVTGAIWIVDISQLDEARKLISDYQNELALNARVEYEKGFSSGEIKSLFQVMKENPFPACIFTFIILFVISVYIYNIVIRL